MSLFFHINFNEDNTSTVRDYSQNGHDGSVSGALTIDNSEVGKKGEFSGGQSIDHGDISAIDGAASISVSGKFMINSGFSGDLYIFDKLNVISLYVDDSDSDKLKCFADFNGAPSGTIASDNGLSVDTWYDFAVVYDGSDLKMYLDGSVQSATLVRTDPLESSVFAFTVGADGNGANYLDGDVEWMSMYDDAITTDEITALKDNSTGVEIDTGADHSFTEGDLLTVNPFDSSRQYVVTLDQSATKIRAIPFTTTRVKVGQYLQRVGNLFDTDRQKFSYINENSNDPVITWRTVTKFSDLTSDAQILHHFGAQLMAIKPTRPAEITSDQDDYDLTGFSRAILSSDASRNISGVSAGQWDGYDMWIYNEGSNNIVIQDEDAGSTAANRFAIGGNLTLQQREAAHFIYDGTSSRWIVLGTSGTFV